MIGSKSFRLSMILLGKRIDIRTLVPPANALPGLCGEYALLYRAACWSATAVVASSARVIELNG